MKVLFCFAILTALIQPNPAHATLGESEVSIEALRKLTRSTRQAVRASSMRSSSNKPVFTLHTLKHPGGEIREYLNAQGVVFAVAWQGFRTPDTAALLGRFKTEASRLEKSQPRKAGARSFEGKNQRILMSRTGHPRAVRGRVIAYDFLPKGVSANEIQ
jgi:hypothetical protein